MMPTLSVVINTVNNAKELSRVLASIEKLANEIIVVDMESTDESIMIAKSFGAKVISHKRMEYVELVRNFGISQATSEWVLILDPDEEVGSELAEEIRRLIKNNEAD